MPKSLTIDPQEVRKSSTLTAPEVPVCQYALGIDAERKRYTDEQLVGVFEDMCLIREFETMLQQGDLSWVVPDQIIAFSSP